MIEDPAERAATLRRAWGLARDLLVVAAQVRVPARGNGYAEFGGGVVTSRGTFQKYYEQGELREYLEAELVAAIAGARLPGLHGEQESELRSFTTSSSRQAIPRWKLGTRTG